MSPGQTTSEPDAYRALVESVAAGAFAMVGAGSSARLGYPPWTSLLERLGQEAQKESPNDPSLAAAAASQDVLVRAETYKRVLGAQRVGQFVSEIYSSKAVRFDAFHQDLVRVPFLHVLTTNYEDVLEDAQAHTFGPASFRRFDFDEVASRTAFLQALGDRKAPRHFVHVHGSIRRPDHIVLTLDDYRQRYSKTNDAASALGTVFTLRPVVFIGFGLTDAYFMHLLDVLVAYLGAPEPRHFAVMPSPGDAQAEAVKRLEWQTRYGITPVFYDPADNHRALHDLIARLGRDASALRREREARELEPVVRDLLAHIYGNGAAPVTHLEAVERASAAMGLVLIAAGSGPIAPGVTGAAAGAYERTPLDDEIDGIYEHIKAGRPAVSLALYHAILTRPGVELTDRLRYRLHANRGSAYLASSRPDAAAAEYLAAAKFGRDSKEARAFEAIGHHLAGDAAKAHELAVALCEDEPGFPRAHAIRLRSLPGGSTAVARRSVPRSVRRDAEVAQALSGVAGAAGDLGRQERYARIAARVSRDWGEAWLALGVAILVRERGAADIDVDRGLVPKNIERVLEAEAAFTRALELFKADYSPAHQGAAYFNRSVARRMLGDFDGSREDLTMAYDRRPDEPEVVARLAWQHEQDDDLDGALRVLERFAGAADDPNTAFVWALVLYRRQGEGDLETAARLLSRWLPDQAGPELGPPPPPVVAQSRRHVAPGNLADMAHVLSSVYIAMGQRERAVQLFRTLPSGVLPRGIGEARLARVVFDRGNAAREAEARELVRAAAEQVDGDDDGGGGGDWFSRREVAVVAGDVGDYPTAFKLLRRIVPPVRFNSDTVRLLRAAHFAGEDAFVLQFCADLRNAGVWERDAVALEINTLIKGHETGAAIELMRTWLERHPEDKEVRLSLSAVGVRQDRPELVEPDPGKLPSSAEVSVAGRGATVVNVLAHGPAPEAAARYAYALWRRFPDDLTAQHTLISIVFRPGRAKAALENPNAVDEWSAVTIREDGSNETRTLVIEGGSDPAPRPTLQEFPPDHPLVRGLRGTRAGDEVVNPVTGRRVRIVSIDNKIVYRARQCMEQFEDAFHGDGEPLIRRFHVPGEVPAGADAEAALGEVWEFLQADDRHRQELLALYQQVAIPVSRLAHAVGRSVLETMGYLAGTDDMGVLASAGVGQEWQEAVAAAQGSREIVLDDSAVATVFMLSLHEQLDRLPFRCVVPEAVVADLRELRRNFDADGTAGYLGVVDGRPSLTEVSAQQRSAWAGQIDGLIAALQRHCAVVGGRARLEVLPSELRDQLPPVIGFGVTDALAIAKARNAPLWTDDFFVSSQLCAKLGVRRVWTQPVLDAAARKVPQFSATARPAVAKLFLSGYQLMRLSVATVVDLLEQSGWNPEERKAKRVLSYLALVGGMNPSNCGVSQLLLVTLWKRCPSERKAATLVRQSLDAIGRDVAGPLIARPLYRGGHPLVPRGVPKWRRLRNVLRSWRSRPDERSRHRRS